VIQIETKVQAAPVWSQYSSITSLPLNSVVAQVVLQKTSDGNILSIKGYATPHIDAQIAKIEVSIDAGVTWCPARITYQAGPWSWTLWEAEVTGIDEHGTVNSRAIDCNGNQQQKDCKWNLRGVAFNPWGVCKW
jgi:sulfite oxidase